MKPSLTFMAIFGALMFLAGLLIGYNAGEGRSVGVDRQGRIVCP